MFITFPSRTVKWPVGKYRDPVFRACYLRCCHIIHFVTRASVAWVENDLLSRAKAASLVGAIAGCSLRQCGLL